VGHTGSSPSLATSNRRRALTSCRRLAGSPASSAPSLDHEIIAQGEAEEIMGAIETTLCTRPLSRRRYKVWRSPRDLENRARRSPFSASGKKDRARFCIGQDRDVRRRTKHPATRRGNGRRQRGARLFASRLGTCRAGEEHPHYAPWPAAMVIYDAIVINLMPTLQDGPAGRRSVNAPLLAALVFKSAGGGS
jgi:hypothetical protein